MSFKNRIIGEYHSWKARRHSGDLKTAMLKAEATRQEMAKVHQEGRLARFQGKSIADCPYLKSDDARQKAWLEGFNHVDETGPIMPVDYE